MEQSHFQLGIKINAQLVLSAFVIAISNVPGTVQ
jgi:hypothetical protein